MGIEKKKSISLSFVSNLFSTRPRQQKWTETEQKWTKILTCCRPRTTHLCSLYPSRPGWFPCRSRMDRAFRDCWWPSAPWRRRWFWNDQTLEVNLWDFLKRYSWIFKSTLVEFFEWLRKWLFLGIYDDMSWRICGIGKGLIFIHFLPNPFGPTC